MGRRASFAEAVVKIALCLYIRYQMHKGERPMHKCVHCGKTKNANRMSYLKGLWFCGIFCYRQYFHLN